jgi:MFS family permease
VERLQMLGCVRGRLFAGARELLHTTRSLGEQVEPAWAGKRLAHERDRLEQSVLSAPVYGGVALAAGLSGWLAATLAARDVLVVAAAIVAVVGVMLSVLFVRDTAAHVALEQADHHQGADGSQPTLRSAFARATYREPALRSCSQAGLVNNLNDGLAWGLVPLLLAAHGAGVADISLIAALYPAVWSVAQIGTGHWSDRVGRKPLIAAGMLVQAGALSLLALREVHSRWPQQRQRCLVRARQWSIRR